MTTFEKNLQALFEINSLLAHKIAAVETNLLYEVFANSNPLDTNLVDNKTHTPLYENAAQETTLALQNYARYSHYPYLYFFGLGNGMFYKLLLQNQRHKRVAVFEPEVEIFYIVLHLVDFSQELLEGRLLLLHCEDVTLDVATHIMQEARTFLKTYDLHRLLAYYDYAHEEMVRINRLNLRAMHYILYSLGNDPKDSLEGVENFIANLPEMVQRPKLSDALLSLKKSQTAIIVSTGPSLAKQLVLLKEIAPYATIISIDASFPILYRHGIKPDAVVSLERVVATSAFYKNVPEAFCEGIVFFISALAHKALLYGLQNRTVQLSMRPFGYMNYFELDAWGYVGIGTSAANMAFELAFHAEFENIVFIGQDLAYAPDGQSHSEDHIFGKNEIHTSREYIQIEGYGGGHTVATTVTWKNFLDFFERNIPLVNTKIRVINATEGGARIHGTIERPFADVVQETHATQPLKRATILNVPDAKETQNNLKKIEQKIAHYLSYGKRVQKEIETIFLEVAAYLQDHGDSLETLDLAKVSLEELESLVAQIEVARALLDDPLFTQLFYDSYQSVIVQKEMQNAMIQVMPQENEQEKKEKLFLWVKAHKQWLFFLAGAIDATLHSIERGKSSWYKKECFVSKVTLKNNYLSGYLYDLYDPSKDFTIEICKDDQVVLTTTANHPQPNFQVLDAQDRHHAFLTELPAEFFDATPHALLLREATTKEMLKHGYAKFQLDEAQRVQGSVQSRNHVLYSGWCKKVGSSEKQPVDVYIDEQHIDTLIADRSVPAFKHLYGDEKYGFEFIIPEAYFDAKEHTIKFTPVANPLAMKEDKDTFVLSEADIGKQREAMFLRSLEEIDPEKIKDLYSPNAIGFLATEENLADEEFVGYIKELMVRFKCVKFIAYVLQTSLYNQVNTLFKNINFFTLNSIYDLQNTKVFIVNIRQKIDLMISRKCFLKNVYISTYHGDIRLKNIEQINAQKVLDIYRIHHQDFGISKQESLVYSNHIKVGEIILTKKLEGNNLKLKEKSMYNDYILHFIDLALQHEVFIKNSTTLRMTLWKYL